MRIGIVTNYANINYGSALQSYALQETLRKLGYECENIRYGYGQKSSLIISSKTVLGRCKRKCMGVRDRRDVFRCFRKKYLNEGSRLYKSLDELKKANELYDAFICGSDQIWAPNQFNPWYFLSFVNDEKPKIAYAPSIGLPSIPPKLKGPMRDLISRIDSVSIREEHGAEIIRELADIDVSVVLDPTLLLNKEQWMKAATNFDINGRYAFCYFLGDNPAHKRAARTYCDDHELRMVAPFDKGDMSLFDDVLDGVGPGEFLDLISNARAVLTDSFHGAAFSVNFGADFYVFLRFSSKDELCQNSRIHNLLDKFDLQDRLVPANSIVVEKHSEINYNLVSTVLEDHRASSREYLKKALESV